MNLLMVFMAVCFIAIMPSPKPQFSAIPETKKTIISPFHSIVWDIDKQQEGKSPGKRNLKGSPRITIKKRGACNIQSQLLQLSPGLRHLPLVQWRFIQNLFFI